ncbi:hypothetical protein A6R68_02520 [Neotoma lepida]|uniref:Small ribosomal subunit protein uS5 C-terminal domain-containing protein n=1 Tax=Neotoma lepida TaxID=56216 RepID=A0A1A6GSP5_NEOLE|nr:hypothetical protein A6R68_02520 [Neotoma lepida]
MKWDREKNVKYGPNSPGREPTEGKAAKRTGIISAPVPKKLLLMAGIDDFQMSAKGFPATLANFTKATFDAISKTYSNRTL